MEWLLANNDSHQAIYDLRTNDKTVLVLTYHLKSGAARISSDNEKRVFLVEREGFLRNRTVLRNEYGIRIGQLTHETGHAVHGNIEIANDLFNYTVQNDSQKVFISKEGNAVVVCDLPAESKSPSTSLDLLLLTLCWHLEATVKRRKIEYA
ncbi:MAG TPA: hypothetical protein VGI82_07340 [Chitinophagaceae bacterium]